MFSDGSIRLKGAEVSLRFFRASQRQIRRSVGRTGGQERLRVASVGTMTLEEQPRVQKRHARQSAPDRHHRQQHYGPVRRHRLKPQALVAWRLVLIG